MTNPNVPIHQIPFTQATSMTGEVRAITQWRVPLGSARIAVVWCPFCDYSQQVAFSDACGYCRAHYARSPQVDPVEVEPLVEQFRPAVAALVCPTCGRDDFTTQSGLISHSRAHDREAEATEAAAE